jgi:ECF transporter S component (folate family)
MRPVKNTHLLVTVAMLIAVDIVLTRLLAVYLTPTLRISFGFIAIALIGIRFGPIAAGVAASISDVLGFLILNTSGSPFFPGFTVSAFVMGSIYGLILYKRNCQIRLIAISALLVLIVVELGMNTLWLSIMYGKGFYILLLPRLVKVAVMLPVQIGLIFAVWKVLGRTVPGFSTSKPADDH